uniref:Uncharacterized protein n=1 Tax=Aegilops tauschii subsp. strangulata TaxID=200361 RepID=A0A453FES1_AEGTS
LLYDYFISTIFLIFLPDLVSTKGLLMYCPVKFKAGDSTPGSSSTATITTSTKNANIKKEKMGTISKERSSKKSRKETELVGSSPVRPEKEEKLCVLPSEASA